MPKMCVFHMSQITPLSLRQAWLLTYCDCNVLCVSVLHITKNCYVYNCIVYCVSAGAIKYNT